MVHNFGKIPVSLIISTNNRFRATPYQHFMNPGEFLDVKISCKAPEIGHIKDSIYVLYNDLKVAVSVECEVYTIEVQLEKNNLVFDSTYMGLKRQATVTVYNQNDRLINFTWKLHKDSQIEQLEKTNTVKKLERIKELEQKRCNKLEMMDIIDYEGHSRIYEQIFEDEVAELNKDDKYLYQHPVFDIMPMMGQILPNNKQTFVVTFGPIKSELYESCAYLDVTGVDHRLPLKLSGRGQGPYASLNVKVLNIGDVFLCATHDYEIAVKNEGNIPATVVFQECVTTFDALIKCTPKKIRLQHQDCCDVFVVSFYSEIKGTFLETVEFSVKESGEKLQFVMTGNVVCPLLKLDVKELDFGVFPFGEVQLKSFLITNDCQVPIEFYILLENIDDKIEFNPKEGLVEPYSEQQVSVELNCSRSREVHTNMKVVMWRSEQYAISIPLKYNCDCPKLKCNPRDVKIKFCFLNYHYKRTIKFNNDAGVAGFVTYTPNPDCNGNVTCTLNKTSFVINAFDCEEIELSIITNVLGLNELPLLFTVAGSDPQELCRITVDGQGPVVSFRPDEVNFDKVTLLKTATEVLTFVNDSPIKALVRIMKEPDSFFEVDVDELEIMPDEEKSIQISVHLTDTGKYTESINAVVHNGESIDIKVYAEGVGHSLICEPDLSPEFDTGLQLTHQLFNLPIKMSNLGRSFYKIRWTPYSITTIRDKLDEPTPGYCFQIKPDFFELSSFTSKTFEITGHSSEQKSVEEEFFCYALVEKASKPSIVTSFKIKTKFMEPTVIISKPALDVLIAEGDGDVEMEDDIKIMNPIDMPMALDLYTNNGYYIVQDNHSQSYLRQEIKALETETVKIKFAPAVQERRYFKRTGDLVLAFVNHPHSVKVEVTTEVCFPTLSLSQSHLEFNCIPLNSYAYKTIVIKNVTMLPLDYKWEIVEELFEIEKLATDDKKGVSFNKNDTGDVNEKTDHEETNQEKDDEKHNDKWDRDDYIRDMKNILRPIMAKFMEDSNELVLLEGRSNNSKCSESYEFKLNNILTVEPYEGRLEPFEHGVVTVGFFPPANTKIQAKVICNVFGGEHETLSIVGISCPISYKLDKDFVEFGSKLFCEVCDTTVVLKNDGYCMFNCTVLCDAFTQNLEPGWLYVTPKTAVLQPGDSVVLKIKYFPGIVGEFKSAFIVKIGYLDSFSVKIHGYAVFSQIYIYLPRPLMGEQPVDISYRAITDLTDDYLESVEKVNVIYSEACQQAQDADSDPEIIHQQLKGEWVVVSERDTSLSVMDIDLSVERLLLEEQLFDHPEIIQDHTIRRKVRHIPNFEIPAYSLDFGYVVVERPVCYKIVLLNYGPVETEIKMTKAGANSEASPFKIGFRAKRLSVGEVLHFYVIFSPKQKKFPILDAKVMETIFISVTHGATIPIMLNATVTIPHLSVAQTSIDFGMVHIGQCLRNGVAIRNDGHVLAKWSIQSKKKNSFFIQPHKGELLPGKNMMLEVYFMPLVKDLITDRLEIYIEGNHNEMTIDLCGHGAESCLEFDPADINFNGILPYTRTNTMVLNVANKSNIPIEFCFEDFDKQFKDEILWINTYFTTHSVKYVLVPERRAGNPLHEIFRANYLTYTNELRQELLLKSQTFQDAAVLEAQPVLEDPLLNMSPEEFEKLLNDYIESKHIAEDSGTDARKSFGSNSSMTIVEPTCEDKKEHNSVFIIFHGGPHTEYVKTARKTGEKLDMPVYSIDKLIYEALIEADGSSALKIKNLIEEEFQNVATNEDLDAILDEDEYDVLTRKTYAILHNTKLKIRKKNSKPQFGTKNSRISERASVKQTREQVIRKDNVTPADIPIELFEDLLRQKLRSFRSGLVIESLNSEFIKKLNVALSTLLGAMGYSKYIHIVLLSLTFEDYAEGRYISEKMRGVSVQKSASVKSAPKDNTDKATASSRDTSKTKQTRKSSRSVTAPASEFSSRLAVSKVSSRDEKVGFDIFENFLSEAIQICQCWDKKNGVMIKKIKSTSDTKMAPKDVKSVYQKKKVSLLLEDSRNEGIGLLLWVINNANKDKLLNFPEIVSDLLKCDPYIEEMQRNLPGNSQEPKEFPVLFSVMTQRREKYLGSSDFFVIRNYTEDHKSALEVTNLRSLLSITSAKNPKKKQKTAEKTLLGDADKQSYILEQRQLSTRQVLQPDQVAQYQVLFAPKHHGTYKHNFVVEITSLNANHMLNCFAVCELPNIDLDPKVLYPSVVQLDNGNASNSCFVYIKESNVFDFGLVLFDSEKVYRYYSQILLKNISHLPCQVSASLSEKSHYSLEWNTTTIDPHEEAYLSISVKAFKAGVLQSALCIAVKNNPKAYMVMLETKACRLDLKIKPKTLSFEKVPVNHTLSKKINISNHTAINLLWKLDDFEWALPIYHLSKFEGTLASYGETDVIVKYSPRQEETHHKKSIEILLFDPHYSKEKPVHVDSVVLSAEAIEYKIDYDDHIPLGEVKGGIEYKIPFTLINRASCHICVTFTKIDKPQDTDKLVRAFFELKNTSETLIPNKAFTGHLLFTPTKAVEFRETPIFMLNIVECNHHESVMDSFVMKVSAKVFFSSFEIWPPSGISFGHQQIHSTKKLVMELKNTGKFPFTFTLLDPKAMNARSCEILAITKSKTKTQNGSKTNATSKLEKETKKSGSKKSGSKKSKEVVKSPAVEDANKDKLKKGKLSLECFTIETTVGEVMPNEVSRIEVDCTPQDNREYKTDVKVFVSEPAEKDLRGRNFTLSVTGCEPFLNFDDFKKIFKEQFITDKLENLNLPDDIETCCIYESSEVTLHYKKVCVHTESASRIFIQNIGNVTAHLKSKLLDKSNSAFKISPVDIDIQPFTTASISIVFKPECVGESLSVLEIIYNSSVNNKFFLTLAGEGVMPKVATVQPEVKDNEGVISFDPTYIGHTRSHTICIRNTGPISAKSIFEISNVDDMFTFVVHEDSHSLLNISDVKEFQNTKHSTLVNLRPNQTASFDLMFTPNKKKTIKTEMKIHTVNNPFEIVQITVKAEGYYHDLYVKGLPPCTQKDANTGYDIDFGYAALNVLQKKVFSIKNNSDEYTYKFEFSKTGSFTFIPSVGHLTPFTSKEIIVTFFSRIPLFLDKELLECIVQKIECLDSDPTALPWDERQQFTCEYYTTDVDSTTTLSDTSSGDELDVMRTDSKENPMKHMHKATLKPEPKYTVVAGSKESIPLFVSISVDYSSYKCEVEQIDFPDTFINETNEVSFEIANPGTVALNINWSFMNDPNVTPRATSTDEIEEIERESSLKNSTLKTSSSETTLFSPYYSSSFVKELELPFTIKPQNVSIHPGTHQQFSVRFSPLHLSEYCVKLLANIICLTPDLNNINIKVKGKSRLPTHYFENVNGISSLSSEVSDCGINEYQNAQVIEFESVGIGVQSERKINVVNPGHEMFTYKIYSVEQYEAFSYFDCKTPTGCVAGGRKSEIVFTFRSQEFGTFEGQYIFEILEQSKTVPFLLTGRCKLPSVHFTKSHVSIQPTVLTVPSSVTVVLKNQEDTDLSFRFLNESLWDESQEQKLEISPKCGKLRPNSEKSIRITFKAEKIGGVDFCIQCSVEKIPTALLLSVFAQCVQVLPSISYISKTDGVQRFLETNTDNIVSFGMINVKRKENIQFTIFNAGKTGFFYTIHFNAKPIEHLFTITVNPVKDFVESGKKARVVVNLEALRKTVLSDFKVKIAISYGPTYVLNIKAQATTPMVKLSFHSYNFGYCLVQERKSNYYNASLEIKNVGNKTLVIENDFKDNDDLTVDFKGSQIQPFCSQHIPIYFHPLKVGEYDINVPLKVNSVKHTVYITGEAVNVDLQLANTEDKFINLGGVTVGSTKTYAVQVINRTQAHVNVFFDVYQRLPCHSRPLERIDSEIKVPEMNASTSWNKSIKKSEEKPNKEMKKKPSKVDKTGSKKEDNASKVTKEPKISKTGKKQNKMENEKIQKIEEEPIQRTQQDPIEVIEPARIKASDFLQVIPRDCVQLGPDKRFQFNLNFTPTEHIGDFSEQIFYEVQDYVKPLCIVKGYSIAPDFVLSQSSLIFSNVVVGLRHSVNILLRNIGAIGGRFEWVFEKGIDEFKITPSSGVVCPSSELKIGVSYEPRKADSAIKTTAKCLIEGLEKTLELNLEGTSIKVPAPMSTVYFTCAVREESVQHVRIVNRSLDRWKIHPIVFGDYFSTANKIVVGPESDSTFRIAYRPQMMANLTPHNAKLFLPLPEGKAIIYELIGQTQPPHPIKRIKLYIKAKKNYTEHLSIKNWLNSKQSFKVTTQLVTPVTPKCLYKISGNPLTELLPYESKLYHWKIYTINEIPLDFRVTFTNIDTQEYMYYEISINVLPSEPIEALNLTTIVRKPIESTICLNNPIDYPVTFAINCDNADIFVDQHVTVQPYTSSKLLIQYCPLKPDQAKAILNATSLELGTFGYSLNLTAQPPLPEQTIRLITELGDKVTKSIVWKNVFKVPIEFTAKFDHPAVFSMDKVSPISEGQSEKIKFNFEPNNLGIFQSKVILSSPYAGSYIYPLVGECVLPTAKGPYTIKPGGSLLVNFLNPFTEDQLFNYKIDSHAFYLKTNSEVVKAKKSTKITVFMQSLKQLNLPPVPCQITGKLCVEAVNETIGTVKWRFYIESDNS
ncbi:hypothetical protein NQ315_015670 [Exocentrus adspersus]|uniref:HYDIN/VesB/CFA65-like Ig-like domain-containing protein n=1 Tax=Exocentrus adspersus TaxID=1586481 RepID=A0AAV8W3L9_9CUCU|nr:hypothetical protein NQ315_015670 [Exocentrus adspersus]